MFDTTPPASASRGLPLNRTGVAREVHARPFDGTLREEGELLVGVVPLEPPQRSEQRVTRVGRDHATVLHPHQLQEGIAVVGDGGGVVGERHHLAPRPRVRAC